MTLPPTQIAAVRAQSSGAANPMASRPAAHISKLASPYVQFEAFVLQSFIQSMMPEKASEIYGEGTAGEVWKSMLAEKMAKQIAEHGGIGIAKMIAPKDGAAAADPAQEMALRNAATEKIVDWRIGSMPTAAAALTASDDSALPD